MTELSDVMIGMEQQFEERESEARAEFQSLRDEIKNKNLEERQSLRVQVIKCYSCDILVFQTLAFLSRSHYECTNMLVHLNSARISSGGARR